MGKMQGLIHILQRRKQRANNCLARVGTSKAQRTLSEECILWIGNRGHRASFLNKRPSIFGHVFPATLPRNSMEYVTMFEYDTFWDQYALCSDYFIKYIAYTIQNNENQYQKLKKLIRHCRFDAILWRLCYDHYYASAVTYGSEYSAFISNLTL